MRLGKSGVPSTPKTWVRDAGEVERPRQGSLFQAPKVKVVVYTALFGDADRLWSVPPMAARGVKYIVFTEKPRREVGLWTYDFSHEHPTMLKGTDYVSPLNCYWEQRIIKPPYEDRKSARYYKALAHKVLRDVDVSIWVDANVRLVLPPKLAADWVSRRDLAVFKHMKRTCLYAEAQVCLMLGLGSKDLINAQVRAYRKLKMPKRWGLATTRCMIRRHTPEMAKLNEAWWKETQKQSLRDQLSLPFVCWREGFQWEMVPEAVRGNKDFWFIPHDRHIR